MIRKVARDIWQGLVDGWAPVREFAPVLCIVTAGIVLIWSSATHGGCK